MKIYCGDCAEVIGLVRVLAAIKVSLANDLTLLRCCQVPIFIDGIHPLLYEERNDAGGVDPPAPLILPLLEGGSVARY
jgi:hypothetical protein